MPYINTKTSISLSKEKEIALKQKLGKAIELLAGKSENYLMLSFEDNVKLWFKGKNDAPIAYVEVSAFGSVDRADADRLTNEICNILNSELAISPSNIYVKFEETKLWGWNGGLF